MAGGCTGAGDAKWNQIRNIFVHHHPRRFISSGSFCGGAPSAAGGRHGNGVERCALLGLPPLPPPHHAVVVLLAPHPPVADCGAPTRQSE
jgi:hypothetical protein